MAETQQAAGPLRTWLVAVRPFAYTASVLGVALGLAIAHHAGAPVRWLPLAVTLVGVVLFHTAANLLNDCFDFRRGLDTQVNPASGAVVRGLLTPRQVMAAAGLCLVLGVACGLWLWHDSGHVVLLLGLVGTGIAVGYTTAGLCLKFLALGDLAIFIAFGPLIVFGTYWVQAHSFSALPLAWCVPLVLLTVGILHANNWRDIASDPGRGCRTMASLLGDGGSAAYYAVLALGPFVLTVLLFLAGLAWPDELGAPATVLVALLALPMAVKLVRAGGTRRSADRLPFLMLDAQTARAHTAFGVLLVLAFLVGRHLPGVGQ